MTRKTTATQRLKTMACRDCGKPMQVGSNQRKAPRCIDCGVKAATDNLVDLRARSGPGWDRYVQGVLRASSDGTRGSAPPVE